MLQSNKAYILLTIMSYPFLFFLLLLQSRACFASRGFGFVHRSHFIKKEPSVPSENLQGIITVSPSNEPSLEARQESMFTQMDSNQNKQHGSYPDELGGGDEIVEAQDYVKPRRKSPIHN